MFLQITKAKKSLALCLIMASKKTYLSFSFMFAGMTVCEMQLKLEREIQMKINKNFRVEATSGYDISSIVLSLN